MIAEAAEAGTAGPFTVGNRPDAAAVMIAETVAGGRVSEASGGRLLVQLIDAGEGSSGVYTPGVLQRAATERVFRAGTHCYIDHAAALRRGPNGERSIRDLAAVLAEDARWDESLQALVAEATVFGHTELGRPEVLREVAPHIGLSISASALLGPPPDGFSRPMVERIVEAESVDFVVRAGRGGAVLAVLESGRASEAATDDRRDQLARAVRAGWHDPQRDVWAGLADFDDVAQLGWYYVGDQLWQQAYEVAADDQSIKFVGGRVEVRAVTKYVPVANSAGASETDDPEEESVSETMRAELDALRAQVEAESKRASEAEARLAEAAERETVAANKSEAARRVTEAVQGEHPAIGERVKAQVVAAVEAELPADLDARIAAAVKAEKDYAASLTESRLTGFGASTATPAETAKPAQRRTLWDK